MKYAIHDDSSATRGPGNKPTHTGVEGEVIDDQIKVINVPNRGQEQLRKIRVNRVLSPVFMNLAESKKDFHSLKTNDRLNKGKVARYKGNLALYDEMLTQDYQLITWWGPTPGGVDTSQIPRNAENDDDDVDMDNEAGEDEA